uniref:hypothetical protein n=1 Tax=Salmonella sp. SAL4446 TaxID=3159901 RepID=UPI0039782EC3
IFSINSALPVETQLGHELLENNFNTWWTKLKADLDKIPSASADTRTFYKWLRTFDDLSVHDLTCDCKEVWIVASDVFRYATQFEAKQR